MKVPVCKKMQPDQFQISIIQVKLNGHGAGLLFPFKKMKFMTILNKGLDISHI
jgi:hypothetical protein